MNYIELTFAIGTLFTAVVTLATVIREKERRKIKQLRAKYITAINNLIAFRELESIFLQELSIINGKTLSSNMNKQRQKLTNKIDSRTSSNSFLKTQLEKESIK